MDGALHLFASVLLCGARFFPVVMLTPLFGGALIPAALRIGVACALGLVSGGADPWEAGGPPPLFFFAAEVFDGFLLSLPIFLVMKALPVAGSLFDAVCGTNSVELVFPGAGERSPVAEQLASMTLTLVCFSSGAHLETASVIAQSYGVAPLGSWIALSAGGLRDVAGLLASAFSSGLALGLPFVAIGLGTELVLSVAGRVAPGVVLSDAAMPVKNVAALVMAVLMYEPLWRVYAGWGKTIVRAAGGLAGLG